MMEYIKTLLSELFPYNSSVELPSWDYRAGDETVKNNFMSHEEVNRAFKMDEVDWIVLKLQNLIERLPD